MAESQDATQEAKPSFNIEKIYVKDLSLEIPHAPQVFLERESPSIDVKLSTDSSAVDAEAGIYEVVVKTTVTASLGKEDEQKTMLLVEAQQAGVFRLTNIPKDEMEPILAVMCPNILFPYLRETVSETSVRAGFAPILLNPVNFEAPYQQQKQQQAEADQSTTH